MSETQRAAMILDRFRNLVDTQIERLLAGRESILLYDVIRHHLGFERQDSEGVRTPTSQQGKRARATLCLLSCQACGGTPEIAAPVAAAVELLHSFTLLHDDIADKDETRRGRPTAWRKWGIGQAITAGDALFALANLAMYKLTGPPEIVAEVIRELNEATLAVCEGQQLDLSYEGRADITVGDYMKMIERKTAALIAAACAMGARVADAPEQMREALREFGRKVGLAFQITDDLLGIWGAASDLGKPVGSDLRRNKRSLPIIYLLQQSEATEREALAARLAGGIGIEEAMELAARMEALGARSLCEDMARESLNKALAALEEAELKSSAKEELKILARFLIERQR